MERNRVKIAQMKPGWRVRVVVGPTVPSGIGVPYTCEGVISEINEHCFRLGVEPLPEEIEAYNRAMVDGTLELDEPTGHSYVVTFGAFTPDSDCGVEVLDMSGTIEAERVAALKQPVRSESEFKAALTVHLPMTAMHLAKVLAAVDEIWPDGSVLDRDPDGDIQVFPL